MSQSFSKKSRTATQWLREIDANHPKAQVKQSTVYKWIAKLKGKLKEKEN
jgi:hypothetical protein